MYATLALIIIILALLSLPLAGACGVLLRRYDAATRRITDLSRELTDAKAACWQMSQALHTAVRSAVAAERDRIYAAAVAETLASLEEARHATLAELERAA